MKTILILIVALAVTANALQPTVDVAISTDIVNSYKTKALEIIRQQISKIQVPNQSEKICKKILFVKVCGDVNLDNIQVNPSFNDQDIQVTFQNNQILLKLKSQIKVNARAHAKITFLKFSADIDADVIADLSLAVSPIADPNSHKLQVAFSNNQFNLDEFNIHIHGSVTGDILNWIKNLFKNEIKSKITEAVNGIIKPGGTAQNEINQQLEKASTGLAVYKNYALDFELSRSPVVTPDRIEAQIFSYVYDKNNKQLPNITAPKDLPKDLASSALNNKIETQVNEYLLNSLGYVLQNDNILQVDIVELLKNYTKIVEKDIETYIKKLNVSVQKVCGGIDNLVNNYYSKLQAELKLIHINLPNLDNQEIVATCQKIGGYVNKTANEAEELAKELIQEAKPFIQNSVQKIIQFVNHTDALIKQVAQKAVQELQTLETQTINEIDQIAALLHIDVTNFTKFVQKAEEEAKIVIKNITDSEQRIVDSIKNFSFNFSLYGKSLQAPQFIFKNNNLTANFDVGLDMKLLGKEIQLNTQLSIQLDPMITANSSLKVQLLGVFIQRIDIILGKKDIDENLLTYLIDKLLNMAVHPLNKIIQEKVAIPLPTQALGFDILKSAFMVEKGAIDISGDVEPVPTIYQEQVENELNFMIEFNFQNISMNKFLE